MSTTLTVRGLDEATKRALRLRAAEHDRSMEAEARAILMDAVARPLTGAELFRQVREIVEANGVFAEDEFDDVRSHDMARAADFGWDE
ncbi:MAG: toxin-antitoxin system [Propionibacteriaceae bacterium]|nr:toxin-antitoxin system [Propionibacteriaceae bacterium]